MVLLSVSQLLILALGHFLLNYLGHRGVAVHVRHFRHFEVDRLAAAAAAQPEVLHTLPRDLGAAAILLVVNVIGVNQLHAALVGAQKARLRLTYGTERKGKGLSSAPRGAGRGGPSTVHCLDTLATATRPASPPPPCARSRPGQARGCARH